MYKTIIVHIDGSPRQASRVAAAARLALEHDAHLVGCAATGISWLDYALLTGATGAPRPQADFDDLRQAAARRLDDFAQQASSLGVASVEARLADDAADCALLLQSRYADLVVLSRDADAAPGTPEPPPRMRRLPEYIALGGVRPVLIVPPDCTGEPPVAKTVVAGWDGSMQALHALVAALPLLRRADSVRLALINPDQMSERHGEQPGADMALYLARQSVKVDVVLERTHATAGAALMALARDASAGLLVTGAYGHSRYREWMLGGVTRELLEHAAVPLLMAH